MLAKSMHQIARIEFRNSKFPYARGIWPLQPPPGGSTPWTPARGPAHWNPRHWLTISAPPPFQRLDPPLGGRPGGDVEISGWGPMAHDYCTTIAAVLKSSQSRSQGFPGWASRIGQNWGLNWRRLIIGKIYGNVIEENLLDVMRKSPWRGALELEYESDEQVPKKVFFVMFTNGKNMVEKLRKKKKKKHAKKRI